MQKYQATWFVHVFHADLFIFFYLKDLYVNVKRMKHKLYFIIRNLLISLGK